MVPNLSNYTSIVTHFDLDGVASAALCAHLFRIESITFTGPSTVESELIDEKTIVCDLPYPRECGLWFDHHMANEKSLLLRHKDISKISGKLENKPSCLHVIYDYFREKYPLKAWESFVLEVDIIDGFLYSSPEEWKKESPAKTIESAIKYNSSDYPFLLSLTLALSEKNYVAVSKESEVAMRAAAFNRQMDSQFQLIKKNSRFVDVLEQIAVIDLTGLQNPPSLQKNLVFVLFPWAQTVLAVHCLYEEGKKTNNLYFSMSLGFLPQEVKRVKDAGEIMRSLNIGDGHPGAAAGQIECHSKIEREKVFHNTVEKIQELWYLQK
jgi:hypothetical protein